MEGNWETRSHVPLVLFALPDEGARENRLEVAIPSLASIILTHRADGVVPGLNDFVTEEGVVTHPPVAPVFWSFRVMVGTGVLMLLVSWSLSLLMLRKRADGQGRRGVEGLPKPALYALVGMSFSGWVATLAGWYTTEIGRQPWLVQGVLTTEAAVGDVPAAMVLSTLVAYLAVYAVLLVAYVAVIFYLARRASRGQGIGPRAGDSRMAQVAVAAE
jgi:cytochrome d ubiquinol oxidase subunit I